MGCFPPGEATNKLASLRAKACKAGIAAPFPFVDLTEFLPSWADDTACVCDDYEDMSSDPKKAAKKKKAKLDMVRWVAAFQSYAIAADAAHVSLFAHGVGHPCVPMHVSAGMEVRLCDGPPERLLGGCSWGGCREEALLSCNHL